MNITELFEMQRTLDYRIIKEHGLEGKDLLQERILALNVELAELAQETRCFKFWSKNQQPSDRVLDELVDVLHFLLSIGIEMEREHNFASISDYMFPHSKGPLKLFIRIFDKIGDFSTYKNGGNYESITAAFLGLASTLGFTWKQLTEAYMAKNTENHARQDRGY